MSEHLFGTCKIDELTQEGVGRGTSEHGVISVPFVLPGEIIHYERFMKYPNSKREKPKFFLKEIEKESPKRAASKCNHFTQCGGCLLQHLDTETYKNFKYSLIQKPFIDHQLDTNCIEEPILLPAGERRRANFEVVKKKEQVFLGFHRWRSHQIIDLTECHTVDPQISNTFQPLREIFWKTMHEFQKATVYLTLTAVGLDISIDLHRGELKEGADKHLSEFASIQKLARLTLRENRKRRLLHQAEIPYVIFDEIKVPVEPNSFLQASNRADKVLTQLVLEALPEKIHKIADLFCGRGTFTFPLSRIAPVDGYECDKDALKTLQEAADKNNRPISTFKRNLFDHPLSSDELKRYNAVMIDPPRAGALAQSQELSNAKNISTIIYVSCGPESFSRDARILSDGGYTLYKVTPVDQFTWAPHLELVGIFKR